MLLHSGIVLMLIVMIKQVASGNGTDCSDALGMENGEIKDSQITVSSVWSSAYGRLARLNKSIPRWGAWCINPKLLKPVTQMEYNEYIKIDLLNVINITKVATQGREYNSGREYTKKYKISYSDDNRKWIYYKDKDSLANPTKIFNGNTDVSTVVSHILDPVILARYIRIHPGFFVDIVCLRLELYGNCKVTPASVMSYSERLQAYNVLDYIIGSLAILLNGLLLLAMFKERKKIFVSRISWLVANLAMADFLTGVFIIFIVQPIMSIDYTKDNEWVQKVKVPLPWIAMFVSFLTLLLMAAERLVVVVLPMTWSTILTTQRTIIGIVFTWVISIAGGVFINYHHFMALFSILVIIEISTLFFIAIHIYILRLLRKREKEKNISNLESSQSNPCIPPELSSQMTTTAHRKVTAVVATLLVVVILTSIPHFICLQIFVTYNVFGVVVNVDAEKYDLAFEYTEAFAYINFVVNPIIYAWRLRMYRKALCGLIKCAFRG